MLREDFELVLNAATTQLNEDVRASEAYRAPLVFQQHVFDVLKTVAAGQGIEVAPSFHPHAFPDIRANGYGIEVKTTTKDSWLSVGNSIFEGMRDPSVKDIYVVFGKLGGMPGVRSGRYDKIITHVRISHAPRFVIEMDRESPLFGKIEVPYDDFCKLTPEEKMRHVRKYSRNRLQKGEKLWWLEDENSPGMPLEIRVYMKLSKKEKIELRAEGAFLFPEIFKGSRVKDKYVDIAFFFLQRHNVFCPQTRDLYSAGSVAGKKRGGNYFLRALQSIEAQIEEAAARLDAKLIEEYWEMPLEKDRIAQWLRIADAYATGWRPSQMLFSGRYGRTG